MLRRSFLKLLGALGVGAVAPKVVTPVAKAQPIVKLTVPLYSPAKLSSCGINEGCTTTLLQSACGATLVVGDVTLRVGETAKVINGRWRKI